MKTETNPSFPIVPSSESRAKSYDDIFQMYNIPFKAESIWLTAGGECEAFKSFDIDKLIGRPLLADPDEVFSRGYVFFITVQLSYIDEVLHHVLPIIKDIPIINLRVAKDIIEASKIYQGYYGERVQGKAIQLNTADAEQAVLVAERLRKACMGFSGMSLVDSMHLGGPLFVNHILAVNESQHNLKHGYSLFSNFRPLAKSKKPERKLVKWNLVLKTQKKKNSYCTYSGIDLLTFKKCMVAIASAYSTEDIYGRDMRDRLYWQRFAGELLQNEIPLPKTFDFVEKGNRSYLISELIEGPTLEWEVKRLLDKKGWIATSRKNRTQLLRHYQKLMDIIDRLHGKGFVFSCIHPADFIVRHGGKLMLTDAQGLYASGINLPEPPFLYGPQGYIAPERDLGVLPDISGEMYSLAAMFLFFVTGCHPSQTFVREELEYLCQVLKGQSVPPAMANKIAACLCHEPEERPRFEELKAEVIHQLYTLLFK